LAAPGVLLYEPLLGYRAIGYELLFSRLRLAPRVTMRRVGVAAYSQFSAI
jgi:hypothetical protein